MIGEPDPSTAAEVARYTGVVSQAAADTLVPLGALLTRNHAGPAGQLRLDDFIAGK